MANNIELAQKAMLYVKDKKWDYLLIRAFLAFENYHTFSIVPNYNLDWIKGLSNVSKSTRPIVYGDKELVMPVTNATYKRVEFQIGGIRGEGPTYYYPSILLCSLFIDNEVAMSVQYSDKFHVESTSPSDYRMIGVEELHVEKRIDDILLSIDALIAQNDIRKQNESRDRMNRKYEGKFTFGNDKSVDEN